MKTYISGRITGLPYPVCKKNFAEAEDLLKSIGLVPVNPLKNGLSRGNAWSKHMIQDIEILFGCEAIFMLEDWSTSRGARIEHKIAEETDIVILYEIETKHYHGDILKIQRAIKEVTGICFADYASNNRSRETFFARLLFSKKCRELGLDIKQIAAMLSRDRSTVSCYAEKCLEEAKFNHVFREIANKVDERMKL